MTRWLALVMIVCGASVARADRPYVPPAAGSDAAMTAAPQVSPDAEISKPQLQADLGLSVIDLAYELPIGDRAAIAVEGGIMGTYFLPWFSAGDNATGWNVGARGAWFSRARQHGVYVTPYVRMGELYANSQHGAAVTTGAFVGYAFGLASWLDLRLGAGAQYIYYDFGGAKANTPFIALDTELCWRL